MDKDLRNRLYWLQEELTEEERELLFDEDEEPEFIEPPRRRKLSYAEKSERQKLQELDPIEARSIPVVKKKGIKGLVFLAILEIIGILLVMGWWLQWLI
jgi:hypothetical protein